MYALLINSLSNPTILSAQRIQFEPDLPEPPVEEQFTLPLPLTSCEKFSNLNFMDAIGSGSAFISNLNGPLQFSSQLLQGTISNVIDGRNILIKGTFTIDVPIQFWNCKIKIEEGGEIIVKSAFKSRFSHYFACVGMWKGMKVENVGTLYMDAFGSIEDALNAVDVTEKCKRLSISNTTFNRNIVGMFLHSTTASPSTIIFQYFNRNKFTCTSSLNNHRRGGRCGILASAVNLPNLGNIPWTSTPPIVPKDEANVFKGNIGTGIEATASLLNIKLCRFSEINNIGIDALNCNMTLIGLGTPYKGQPWGTNQLVPDENEVTFFNCANGAIVTRKSHLTVTKASLYFNSVLSENINSMIQCLDNAHEEKIKISDNHFYIVDSKPDLSMVLISRSSAQLEINDNEFEALYNAHTIGKKRIAIHLLKGSSSENPSIAEVKRNKFYFPALCNSEGIKIDGGANYSILENEIPNFGNRTQIGINAIDIKATSEIKANYMDFAEIGMRFFSTLQKFQQSSDRSASSSIYVCDNRVEGSKKAMQFIGIHGIVLANNFLYDNDKALSLEKGAVANARIGKQWNEEKYRKNFFERQQGIQTTKNTAEMPDNGDPDLSQFAVDTRGNLPSNTTGMEYSKVVFENIKPDKFRTTWFKNEPVTDDVGCTIIAGTVAGWASLDDAILDGIEANEIPALRWEAESYLFDKLLVYPELLIGHPEREAFFNQKQNSNIPIFNQLRKDIDNVFELTAQQKGQMNTLQASFHDTKTQWIALAEQYNQEFGENEWSEQANNIMLGVSTNLSNIQGEISSLNAQITAIANDKIQNLIALNANIGTESVHELYAKKANCYWLKMLLTKNHLSSAELSAVRAIATTCHKEAGRAKFIAINTLPKDETESYMNTACVTPLSGGIAYKQQVATFGFTIIPNPAKELLNVKVESTISNPCTSLSLLDISGKVLKKIENTIENTIFLIETNDLNNGIYFLRVKCKDNSSKIQKVVILH